LTLGADFTVLSFLLVCVTTHGVGFTATGLGVGWGLARVAVTAQP
jgi:hypothetical protein